MAKIPNIFKGDKVIWMIFFFLCIISIVEVYSASSELTYTGDIFGPIIKHSGMLLLGFIAILFISRIPCRYFKLFTPALLTISIILLLVVLFVGGSTNDAQRWLQFAGIQFQPSELAKGSLILAVAQILSFMQTEEGADKRAFFYILVLCLFILVPIMFENLSTALLMGIVVLLMMIIGRVPWSQIAKLIGVVFAIGIVAIVLIMITGKVDSPEEDIENGEIELVTTDGQQKQNNKSDIFHRMGTWKSRILNFVNDEEIDKNNFDWDKNGQTAHAHIAIASSNIIGRGPGHSEERDWLPQAFSDFIYAIIIEELGILGAIAVVFLYIVLLFRIGRIANNCERPFPAILAMGIGILLVSQAMVNMCVAVGLVPVTGQPLPLISKGGTSTIINCIYIGVILSISRTAILKDSAKIKMANLEEEKV